MKAREKEKMRKNKEKIGGERDNAGRAIKDGNRKNEEREPLGDGERESAGN